MKIPLLTELKHDFAPGLIQPLCRAQLPDLVEIGKKHEQCFFRPTKEAIQKRIN